MELIFQVIAGIAAGRAADTSDIGVAINEYMSVTPNTYGTNFFIVLNLTGPSVPGTIRMQVALKIQKLLGSFRSQEHFISNF